jgi:hypothetical protein
MRATSFGSKVYMKNIYYLFILKREEKKERKKRGFYSYVLKERQKTK